MTTYKPMVNHLTRVVFTLIDDPPYDTVCTDAAPTADGVRRFGDALKGRTERVAAMMEALAAKGFVFKTEKGRVLADSSEMEAEAAKRYLLSCGFEHTEFQVLLEYARKWGVM